MSPKRTAWLSAIAAATMLAVSACSSATKTSANDSSTTAAGAGTTASPATTTGSGGSNGPSADLNAFKGKTVGVVSLSPGLEPVDRITKGLTDCVAANGGKTQIFDAKGGAQAVQAFEQANSAGVDAIYNVANDVSGGALDAALATAATAKRPVVTAWGGA